MTNKSVLTDDQIARMRYIELIVWREEDHEAIVRFARAIEQAVLLSEQVQAWKRDAERYRTIQNRYDRLTPYNRLEIVRQLGLDSDGYAYCLDHVADAAMGS